MSLKNNYLFYVSLCAFVGLSPKAYASLDLMVDDAQELMSLYSSGYYKSEPKKRDSSEAPFELSPDAAISDLNVKIPSPKRKDPIVTDTTDVGDIVELVANLDPVQVKSSGVSDDQVQKTITKLDQDVDKNLERKTTHNLHQIIFVPDETWVTSDEIGKIRENKDGFYQDAVQSVGIENPKLLKSLSGMSKDADQFIGRKIDFNLVNEIVDFAQEYTRQSDMPFSNVYAPPQNIKNGVIFFVLKAAKIEEIRIAKSEHFDSVRFLKGMNQKIGDPIDIDVLSEDVAKMSIHPDRQLKSSFSQGSIPGTTILNIDIDDQKPWGAFAMRSNSGTRSLDQEQYVFGGYHNNLWGLDHKFSAQYIKSADFNSLSGYNLTYEIPFYYKNNVVFNYSRTDTETDLLSGSFESEGRFESASIKYQRYLFDNIVMPHGYEISNQKLSAGIDYKNISGNVLFTLFGDPVDAGLSTNIDVFNIVTGYEGVLADPYDGFSEYSIEYIFSPGDITTQNSKNSFDAGRENADSSYMYLKASADRSMPVFGEYLDKEAFWNVGFSSQFTNDRLIGSERFVNTAAKGFRGYNSGAFSGDSGLSIYNEIESSPYNLISNDYINDSITVSGFVDWAAFYNNEAVDGEKQSDTITAVGAQVNYTINDVIKNELSISRDLSLKNNDERQTIMYRLLYSY